jgi:hypothetical protein
MAAAFPAIRFLDIYASPLKGAKVPLAHQTSRSPADLAGEIFRQVIGDSG